jgi:pimeloyl-ACP methyl ester carboxylesterase
MDGEIISEPTTNSPFESVLIEDNKSKTLLVAFGGIRVNSIKSPFEFLNILKDNQTTDKIFIRDIHQVWYQKGLADDIQNLSDIADYLKNIISSKKYTNVVFIGNSMGGYAAILLGTLLGVNKIIAFSPQTFIGRFRRLLNLDRRWRKQINNVHANAYKQPEYFDLKPVLKKGNNNSSIEIWYCKTHRLDRLHAERLKKAPNVQLNPVFEGGHNFIKKFRDTGQLHEIITNSVEIKEAS